MSWRDAVEQLYNQYDLVQGNKINYKNSVINYGEILLNYNKFEKFINDLDSRDMNSYPDKSYGNQAIEIYQGMSKEGFIESYNRVSENFKEIKDYTSIEELMDHYESVRNEAFFQAFNKMKTALEINSFFNKRLRNVVNGEDKNTSYWVGKAPDQLKAKYMIDNGCFEIYFTETNIGDMLKYNSIEEVSDTNEWFKNEDGNLRINDRKALWDIAHEIKIGDVIYLALGMNNVVAKGTVIGGYEYNTENRYHQVKVQYDDTFKGTISAKFSRKTLTNITANIELQEQIEFDITNQLSNKEILDISTFDNNAKQLIIDGAPGTGKSYGVEEDIENNNIKHERVTFYQDYEYHNFVGSILPVVNGSDISYEFVKGPFTKILNDALSNPEEKHYLVIEELTRGNAASIFGDIFQLLDRKDNGFSRYGISHENILDSLDEEVQEFLKREFDGKVVLPPNLSIICTINSSDQNVFPLDTAFKRRFDYEIKSTLPSEDFIDFDIKFGELEAGSWKDFYQKLNKFILADLKLKEDKQVGPYFIKNHNNDASKMKSIQTKLAMYMWNDLHKVHTMSTKSIFNSDKVYTLYDVDRIFREGTRKEVLEILSTEFKDHFGLNDE